MTIMVLGWLLQPESITRFPSRGKMDNKMDNEVDTGDWQHRGCNADEYGACWISLVPGQQLAFTPWPKVIENC